MDTNGTDAITVQKSKFGKGIFATRNLPFHSTILKITGKILRFDETLSLGDKECYCLQTDIDQYIVPDSPFYYSNHSCEPNCGINNNLELFTLRPVKAGEELTWDYSTSMLERYWTMECACGTKSCRKIVTDFDLLPPRIQNKYMKLQIVLPFIIHHLHAYSSQAIEMAYLPEQKKIRVV